MTFLSFPSCLFQKLQLTIVVPRQKLHDIAMPRRLVRRQVGLAKGSSAQEIIQRPPAAVAARSLRFIYPMDTCKHLEPFDVWL